MWHIQFHFVLMIIMSTYKSLPHSIKYGLRLFLSPFRIILVRRFVVQDFWQFLKPSKLSYCCQKNVTKVAKLFYFLFSPGFNLMNRKTGLKKNSWIITIKLFGSLLDRPQKKSPICVLWRFQINNIKFHYVYILKFATFIVYFGFCHLFV